ncbi:MAG: DUF4856 domain-containing protein, partial [Bacteroidota bacterium]|nr:DUF4856 domain-containing protein [Bacteroidota bacterium]MDX5430338.1 DUF4856 domain-containing protein [Bacteroidota bacterium]MDX5469099.1 DUF4856 domain-containing protein [Bacteroidota bacterium]
RRDKNDGTGLYSAIEYHFRTLQAATLAGVNYKDEQKQAFQDLIRDIEKGLMATAINYMYTTTDKLTKTNPSDADLASALHDLSEAISFVYGFKELNNVNIQITPAQVQEIMDLLEFGGTENGFYHFVKEPVKYLPQILEAQNKLKEIYQFSGSEMNDFRNNWVSVQGR